MEGGAIARGGRAWRFSQNNSNSSPRPSSPASPDSPAPDDPNPAARSAAIMPRRPVGGARKRAFRESLYRDRSRPSARPYESATPARCRHSCRPKGAPATSMAEPRAGGRHAFLRVPHRQATDPAFRRVPEPGDLYALAKKDRRGKEPRPFPRRSDAACFDQATAPRCPANVRKCEGTPAARNPRARCD